MLLSIVLIPVGVGLIIFGANFLTDGASAVAARYNIPDLIIGLTIVGFGTSTPELTVSLISAINGSGGMSVGNVLGSNIFNVLAILGITALIIPIPVTKAMQKFDIPIGILASIVLVLVLVDLDFAVETESIVTRSEGLLLLGFAYLYMRYIVYMGKKGSQRNSEVNTEVKHMKMGKSVLWTILGLIGLVAGGNLFVRGSSDIARELGVSETVIGLTLVAWGTSLPELATSVVAAIKKDTDMAIGNVIGSNIFNIFMVLGISATISPMRGLEFTYVDLITQFLAMFLLLIFAKYITRGVISRWQGAVMLVLFIAYNAILLQGTL